MKFLPALLVVPALALAGCSASAGPAASDDTIKVVASTNVYGDIATQIGGKYVTVDSIISDSSQDPHSYQGNAQVQLSLSKANVVIENGGGYDDFVDTLLATSKAQATTVLNVANISGYDQHPAEGEFNEHLWFDYPTVAALAKKLSARFSKLDPSHASTFAANTTTFTAALDVLESDEASIKSAHAGEHVAITEPVPLYMLQAAGLKNVTPEAFSEAIEEGTDVSPLVLQKTLALFSERDVKLLADNEQTSGPETDKLLAAAKAADIPIVRVGETLPKGKDYLEWMTDVLAAVKAALR